jgi:two-component sensor histidine kinase
MPSRNMLADLSAPELALRLRQQELVAEFGCFALNKNDDLQAILDEASRVASVGLETACAKVLQCLPKEKAFVVRAGVGWKPGVVGHARVGNDLQSPAGYAFRTGKPVLSKDLDSEPRFRTPKLLAEHGIRSTINVLVRTDSDSFGVLEVDSTNRGEFAASDIAFLQTLANTLGVAIRAQQREDAKAQVLRDKEALLLENEHLLREKDLLVREIHHRVTNSLQLVHSMLSIQVKLLDNEEASAQVGQAASRVLAIAAVHRRLYQAGSSHAADARTYMRALLDDMKALLPFAGRRRLKLDMDRLALSADNLAHLGLIAVELVTNALKHGRGSIELAVKREEDSLKIVVSDEGAGFPASFDPAARDGLGLKIVSAMAGSARGAAIAVDRSVPFSRVAVRMALKAS